MDLIHTVCYVHDCVSSLVQVYESDVHDLYKTTLERRKYHPCHAYSICLSGVKSKERGMFVPLHHRIRMCMCMCMLYRSVFVCLLPPPRVKNSIVCLCISRWK